MVTAVTVLPAVPDQLESLLRRLRRPPPPKPIPTELESLLQRLLAGVPAPKPTPPPKTGITDMETSRVRPGPVHRDWATVVCFSSGKSGRGVGRCPKLNETFPFMLPGWKEEKVRGSYVMVSPLVAVECRRAENGD